MREALDYPLLRTAIALKAGRCEVQAEAIIALASTAERREKMSEAMIFAAVAQNELTPAKVERYGATLFERLAHDSSGPRWAPS